MLYACALTVLYIYLFFQVGEKVDARDLSMGAWFEAQVVKVTIETTPITNGTGSSNGPEETIYYHVKFDE